MRRGLEVACVIAAVALALAFWLVDEDAQLLVMAVWVVVVVAAGAVPLVASLHATARPPELRPQRFTIGRKAFTAPPEADFRLARGPVLLAATGFAMMMIDAHNWFYLVIAAPIANMLRHPRRTSVTLTPAGVTVGLGQTLPWGQPLQVPRELAVNPWFVSAAIQWYANHPDERAGIGTPSGHDRLREALGAADPVKPPRPPLPRNLVLVSRFTWACVAAGVLSAIGEVVLAIVFRSALERTDPSDPDSSSDWGFIAASTVIWLVIAVLAGLLAVAALHAVRRSRSDPARTLLVVLASAAIALSGFPMGSPILALADNEGAAGVLVLYGWIAGKAAVAGPAIAALALLLSVPVREYTRVGSSLRA